MNLNLHLYYVLMILKVNLFSKFMASELLETNIDGIYEINSSFFKDERGFFLNIFRSTEDPFLKIWSNQKIKQVNLSRTSRVGSIRGIHLQRAPFGESKIIRCIKGRVWDVGVDLRRDSKSFLSWHAVTLSPEKGNALFIPEGCGHGFQVLEKDSELIYLHSGEWKSEYEIGVRWNDPSIRIKWPLELTNINDRDSNLPFFSEL